MHSNNDTRPLEWKRCWDPLWDHGQYSQEQCCHELSNEFRPNSWELFQIANGTIPYFQKPNIFGIRDNTDNQDGCLVGQHCLDGACYDNATVCLCDQDSCNDWLPGSNTSQSTPMPVPPTTPASHHTCYYGIKENGSLSLDNTQICRDDQNLCVRITTDEGWEMRSCWDDDFNMEYSRPGCYKVRESR